jgi:asparagine synthase (glutamine-hydrolysing)
MCGLSGFCDFGHHSNETILRLMTDTLTDRGPDDSGYEMIYSDNYQIGLGHRRLSILDLSPLGHQPMSFEQFHIVLNGEIYNYKEIRTVLITQGYSFNSNSDTEVVLKAFHCWGVKAVERFIGMFAFVIYDKVSNKLFLFRDRAGVKPLYYYWKDDVLLFSSEIKTFHKHPSFHKSIDQDALAQYFRFGYIQAPLSIFKDCFKLQPGNYLVFDLQSKEYSISKYWDIQNFYNSPFDSAPPESEVLENLEGLLKSAFEYRMVSDVPVGVFLSGGYDSSLVTAILQKNRPTQLKTFTIGFNNAVYDEAPFAKEIAKHLGTAHSEYYCTEKEAQQIIPTLPDIYDEPFGDSSAIPTILVSRFARKEVTVALSADGGDEIFAGYNAYDIALTYQRKIKSYPKLLKRLMSLFLDGIPSRIIPFTNDIYNFETRYQKARLLLKSKSAEDVLAVIYSSFTENELKKLLINGNFLYSNSMYDNPNYLSDNLNSMLLKDYKGYMCDDILVKVDRATMSVGLEGREPLLDHRIVEYIAKLPGHLKYNNGVKKDLLKKITHKYIPESLLNRPKKGFSIPIEEWFKGDLHFYIEKYLNKKSIESDGLLDYHVVKNLVDNFENSKKPNFQKLWFILMFQMWKEKWL